MVMFLTHRVMNRTMRGKLLSNQTSYFFYHIGVVGSNDDSFIISCFDHDIVFQPGGIPGHHAEGVFEVAVKPEEAAVPSNAFPPGHGCLFYKKGIADFVDRDP